MSSASELFNSFSITADVERGLAGAPISSLPGRSFGAEKPQDLADARHSNSFDRRCHSASATAVIPLDRPINDEARIARFQEIALPYLDDAYNLARWLTRDPQDAEDVVQEAYLRALRYFDNFRGENPRSWVLTIVRNTFYTWIRANRSNDTQSLNESNRHSGEEDISELSDPDQDTAETALLKKDDAALMRALIEQELIAGHVRSLLANHLTDVTASDQHTVKPWFNSKLDVSPPVVDLANDGFPLSGGRLDYLHNRVVGALVYKHAAHVINLFVWPAPDIGDAAADSSSREGYNLLHWTRSGMSFWVVSDLNAVELRQFQEKYSTRTAF